MKRLDSDKTFDVLVYAILAFLLIIFIYPLFFVLIASFSEPSEVVQGRVLFWVKGFTLDSYKNIFTNSRLWNGYKNTAIYTSVGTMLALCITIPAAYAMSKPRLWKRNFFSMFFLIPMYFGGGMLPTYLLVKNIGLTNQWYTQIILGSFSIYNMIVARNYFQSSIPEDIYESAEIDGANQFMQFFRIALPLAKPIIAVIALYYAVGRWNDYWTSLVYVSKSDYQSLQFVLREILLSAQNALQQLGENVSDTDYMVALIRKAYLAEAMKYSVIFVASAPMLCIYPFIQKYFVKGVMVGSLKG